ncbi:hypothetical protein [Halioxenophilus aromaticivorans]|uniref:AMP-dependent synthetase/ligase domain-containing protein n=1 Tax=Halioxenophilus aromaticivorans TaxID=1306992 RepID=A0AAV3TZC1_9ALTE
MGPRSIFPALIFTFVSLAGCDVPLSGDVDISSGGGSKSGFQKKFSKSNDEIITVEHEDGPLAESAHYRKTVDAVSSELVGFLGVKPGDSVLAVVESSSFVMPSIIAAVGGSGVVYQEAIDAPLDHIEPHTVDQVVVIDTITETLMNETQLSLFSTKVQSVLSPAGALFIGSVNGPVSVRTDQSSEYGSVQLSELLIEKLSEEGFVFNGASATLNNAIDITDKKMQRAIPKRVLLRFIKP